MTELAQEEWNEQRLASKNAVLLDVRTEEDLIQNTFQMPKCLTFVNPGFMDEAHKLDKDKAYFIYCRSGARSAQACQVLDHLGVAATFNLKGGILAWTGEVVE